MTTHHVSIGPEFFAKSRNDYDDWHWALVREFFQNSIDCGSANIHFDAILNDDNNTVVTVKNDGTPMDYDTITNKLFSLGSSGKNFTGTVGGFGKAKEILYFCHKSYNIKTGDIFITGSGAAYNVHPDSDYVDGTTSTIEIEGDHVYELINRAKRFVDYAQVSSVFFINGDKSRGCLRKGSLRRDLGFGKVYTNKAHPHKMLVRINGIPMFDYPIGLNRCVIVELSGSSNDVLTSNRDGLVQPFKAQLSDFITELSVDKRSALKKSMIPRYMHYSGAKLSAAKTKVSSILTQSLVQTASTADISSNVEQTTTLDQPNVVDIAGKQMVVTSIGANEAVAHTSSRWGGSAERVGSDAPEIETKLVTIGTDFIIKNETELMVPKHFDPGSVHFSSYSGKLVKIWGRLMLQMHKLFGHEDSFSVGFIFDDGEVSVTEAQYEDSSSFGKVYYLNPAVIVEQRYTYSKSFKKRFKLTDRDRLISIAAHEFVHGLGYGWHDESYANELTNILAQVMKHRRKFNWCFAN